jgi:hypothetical protein
MKPRILGAIAGLSFCVSSAAYGFNCKPPPIYLNVELGAHPADTLFFYANKPTARLREFGYPESVKTLAGAEQKTIQTYKSDSAAQGLSIQLTNTKNCDDRFCYGYPETKISLSPNWPATCQYGPIKQPSPFVVLRSPRLSESCKLPPGTPYEGTNIYAAARIQSCLGVLEYPDERHQKININMGAIAFRFNDNFMLYRSFFMPGITTTVRGSIMRDDLLFYDFTFSQLLSGTGAFLYDIHIEKPKFDYRTDK